MKFNNNSSVKHQALGNSTLTKAHPFPRKCNDQPSESGRCTSPDAALRREALSKRCLRWNYLMHLELPRPPGAVRISTPITNPGPETEEICANTTGSKKEAGSFITCRCFHNRILIVYRTQLFGAMSRCLMKNLIRMMTACSECLKISHCGIPLRQSDTYRSGFPQNPISNYDYQTFPGRPSSW